MNELPDIKGFPPDSRQAARLRTALIEAGCDPETQWSQALELSLGALSDAELRRAIAILAPKPESAVESAPVAAAQKHHEEEFFQRFNLSIRIQHVTMAVSIVILIITGLPLKFHEAALSVWIMNLMGGIDVSSFIHRIGATGLILVGAFHLGYVAFTREGRRDFFLLLPRPKDVIDYYVMIKYYLGFSEIKAKFGRFSYIEKFDYWAVYWGMVIMISSGSLLWFQDFFLKYLPKFILDIATEAHSDEALLATLAIIIWHFYNVHFSPSKFPMSKVFIHGKLTREEMEDEHPLELEEILAKRKGHDRRADDRAGKGGAK